jgi:hypothetical protein
VLENYQWPVVLDAMQELLEKVVADR